MDTATEARSPNKSGMAERRAQRGGGLAALPRPTLAAASKRKIEWRTKRRRGMPSFRLTIVMIIG